MSETALHVLETDASMIVRDGVLGAGNAGHPSWPDGRARSGVVMGAVQSGKTASMLAVTALALDAGVDIVVILGGTRLALWRQTSARFRRDLASTVEAEPDLPAVIIPNDLLVADPATTPTDLYQVPSAQARRALRQRRPILFVTMKHGHHLDALARVLRERVYSATEELGRPIHLLVLDDEADDGSILDARIEAALDPALDPLKQIPRHIADLWSIRERPHETASTQLFSTYIGYTATPQANLLQADQNVLAPRDFLFALRTPWSEGALDPRETTYREPAGLRSFYTGGAAFYARFGSESPLVRGIDVTTTDTERARLIGDAVRGFLVAGAVRLLRDDAGRNLTRIDGQTFASQDEARRASPPPHTMLIHPSAVLDDHFETAAELLAWGRGIDLDDARRAVHAGERALDVSRVASEMDAEPEAWLGWLDDYASSAAEVSRAFDEPAARLIPPRSDWPLVRDVILCDLVPHLHVSIINSDPGADDRPEFDPVLRDERWHRAPDALAIFVSGNVMARGLTLEGLTTTLFLRSSADPVADTQMQMQRWFGYRGAYLDVCRVLATTTQIRLFRQYHETDEALRRQLVQAMNSDDERTPRALVLEGQHFRATGKIAGVSKVPLCPGASPFVDLVNDGHSEDPNVKTVLDLFLADSALVRSNDLDRGRVLLDPLDLGAAADLLDRMHYQSYRPSPHDPLAARWGALHDQLSLGDESAQAIGPFFRPPATGDDAVNPHRCPYTLAAYLRFWRACLDRRAPGLVGTDNGDVPWSLIDLRARKAAAPRFWIGIRFGSKADEDGVLEDTSLGLRLVKRTIEGGRITSTWGSRNPADRAGSYLGDQLFDYHHHGVAAPELRSWRPVGAPGLILFHIVKDPTRTFPVVAVGTAIPLGGPDHFAARVEAQ